MNSAEGEPSLRDQTVPPNEEALSLTEVGKSKITVWIS